MRAAAHAPPGRHRAGAARAQRRYVCHAVAAPPRRSASTGPARGAVSWPRPTATALHYPLSITLPPPPAPLLLPTRPRSPERATRLSALRVNCTFILRDFSPTPTRYFICSTVYPYLYYHHHYIHILHYLTPSARRPSPRRTGDLLYVRMCNEIFPIATILVYRIPLCKPPHRSVPIDTVQSLTPNVCLNFGERACRSSILSRRRKID